MQREKYKGGLPTIKRSAALSSRKSDKDDQPLFLTVLKNSAIGLACAMLSGILLVSASCAVAYANPDPGALMLPLALASLMISMFVGGFVCSKMTKDAPLFCGVICGGIITFGMMLISLCFTKTPSSGYGFLMSAALHAFAIVFCVLGAFAGNYKRKTRSGAKKYWR